MASKCTTSGQEQPGGANPRKRLSVTERGLESQLWSTQDRVTHNGVYEHLYGIIQKLFSDGFLKILKPSPFLTALMKKYSVDINFE